MTAELIIAAVALIVIVGIFRESRPSVIRARADADLVKRGTPYTLRVVHTAVFGSLITAEVPVRQAEAIARVVCDELEDNGLVYDGKSLVPIDELENAS